MSEGSVPAREFDFFFQAEDGIRDLTVTGVQTCALPILGASQLPAGVAVVGRLAQPLLQLRHAPVVVTGVVIGDFEVALRDLHLRVQLERARERDRKSTRLNSVTVKSRMPSSA